MLSAASWVASWARALATVEVTIRYRLPLERATEPTLGSTTTIVSGESVTRSGSAITPSFIWSRTAMRASRVRQSPVIGGGADWRAVAPDSIETPAREAGAAGRSRDYTRGPPRRTWTRSSRAPIPAGEAANAD